VFLRGDDVDGVLGVDLDQEATVGEDADNVDRVDAVEVGFASDHEFSRRGLGDGAEARDELSECHERMAS
jgi:hypothetical protein